MLAKKGLAFKKGTYAARGAKLQEVERKVKALSGAQGHWKWFRSAAGKSMKKIL